MFSDADILQSIPGSEAQKQSLDLGPFGSEAPHGRELNNFGSGEILQREAKTRRTNRPRSPIELTQEGIQQE